MAEQQSPTAQTFDPYHKWLGIAPKDQPPNHYRLLGIDAFESDHDVISQAADQRMAHVRTFQSGQHASESQQLLNELAAARICLLNPVRRPAYDQQLRSELAVKNPIPRAVPVVPKVLPIAQAVPTTEEVADWPAQRTRESKRPKRQPLPLLAVGLVLAMLLIGGAVIYLRNSHDPLSRVTDSRIYDPSKTAATSSGPQPSSNSADKTTTVERPAKLVVHEPQQAPVAVQLPAAPKPKLEPTEMFLRDLPAGELVTHNNAEFKFPGLIVNGFDSKHGLWMHPLTNQPSHVTYRLGKGFDTLEGAVGIGDIPEGPETPITFRVLGDGQLIWESDAMQKPGAPESFRILVDDIDKLELLVDCPGVNYRARAIWVEPRLHRKSAPPPR